jgi:hypothetical protein
MHQAILDPLLMALDQLLKLLFKLAQMLLLDGPGMDMNLRLELYMLLVHLDFDLNKVSDLF